MTAWTKRRRSVMMALLPAHLLILGFFALLGSFNALKPRYSPAGLAAVSFFSGWLTGELAAHLIVIDVAVVAWLVWHDALSTWTGQLGLVLDGIAMLLLLVACSRSYASGGIVATALADLVTHDAPRDGDWRQLFMPLPVRDGRNERLRNIVYYSDGELTLKLDVFRRRDGDFGTSAKKPVLLFVHGGAWMIGNKEYQGLPLLHRFAAHGWVGFSINYRLSPRATFPDHIIDVKRAIAWVRAHAAQYGGDPDFIVIAGGSAGGHLASLAALTPGKREWQPGFETADTAVAACLSFYGVYDFNDRHGHWPNPGLNGLLERYIMKAKLANEPKRFAEASPVSWVGPKAPPFLVVHGTADSIVPVAEARAFVAALRKSGAGRCAYIELPGAQHAFEIFPSLRTIQMLRGVERFAKHVYDERAGATDAYVNADPI
jgi:acetyl esterase/lipase